MVSQRGGQQERRPLPVLLQVLSPVFSFFDALFPFGTFEQDATAFAQCLLQPPVDFAPSAESHISCWHSHSTRGRPCPVAAAADVSDFDPPEVCQSGDRLNNGGRGTKTGCLRAIHSTN